MRKSSRFLLRRENLLHHQFWPAFVNTETWAENQFFGCSNRWQRRKSIVVSLESRTLTRGLIRRLEGWSLIREYEFDAVWMSLPRVDGRTVGRSVGRASPTFLSVPTAVSNQTQKTPARLCKANKIMWSLSCSVESTLVESDSTDTDCSLSSSTSSREPRSRCFGISRNEVSKRNKLQMSFEIEIEICSNFDVWSHGN